MKIASADVSMGSVRVFNEVDSKKEKLNAWVGKRPDSSPKELEDQVTLSSILPKPVTKPAKVKEDDGASCKGPGTGDDDEISTQDGYVYVLKRAIEALTGKKIHMRRIDPDALLQGKPGTEIPPEVVRQAQQGERREGVGWGVEYDRTSTHYESEQTTFAAEGVIRTADGKEIGFSLSLQMSREYMTSESESFRAGDAVQKVDPLVLNFDGNAVELTDAKFAFDLDQDGEQESISFVGSGSGILVLDRNKDGIVNDGGELFGPRTGNGFNELAELDSDQNGWIDENDSAYADLSVWTRSSDGKDALSSLKSRNVGAIYLGNVQTQFDIKSGAALNGQVVRTGVFVEEEGKVGTIQQVDLVT